MKYIKAYIILIAFTFTVIQNTYSQSDSTYLSILNRTEYYSNLYNNSFSYAPSSVGNWNNDSFSFVTLNYTNTQGDFRDFQQFDSDGVVNISAQSVLELEGGWHFFGKFDYTNGKAKNSYYNVSFKLPENGSPVYYFQEQPGIWNYQNYVFDGVAAKKIANDKLILGLGIIYNGDLAFRTVDTRNELYDFNIDLKSSITYNITKDYAITMGYVFRRKKLEPQINDKYSHAGDDAYNLYLNYGLGSYKKNAPWETRLLDLGHYGVLNLDLDMGGTRLLINYEGGFSKEDHSLRLINSLAASAPSYYRYMYSRHRFSATAESNVGNALINTYIKGENTNGQGDLYEDSKYWNNYQSGRTSLELGSNYYRSESLVRGFGIGVGYHSSQAEDMKYNQELKYSRANVQGAIELGSKLSKSVQLGLNMSGQYTHNLSANHNVGAAEGNLFTENIAVHQLMYNSTDFYDLTAQFEIAHILKKSSQTFNYVITGTYRKPVKINNMVDDAYYGLKDNNYSLNINVIYNF